MTFARDLTLRLADLLRREHSALAEFIVALADFDRRRLWLELGHSSLFYFLHRELGLSKGAAFYRKTAAELIQKFPEVIEPLRDGRLCLTSVVELSKVMTPENRGEILPRFFHVSKREAKAVSAEMKPAEAAPHRTVVTAVRSVVAPALAIPTRATHEADGMEPAVRPDEPAPSVMSEGAFELAIQPSATRSRSEAEPLTAELNRLHVTISRRFLEKLEAARDALSHSHPGASDEEVLEAGLDLVLERHAKRWGLVSRPRREPRPSKPGYVPAHVRRAVWKRDGGRCQWPLEGGGICGSTYRVELDHIQPKARGGSSTVENSRLACQVHNQYAARQAYGDEWMDRFTRRRSEREGMTTKRGADHEPTGTGPLARRQERRLHAAPNRRGAVSSEETDRGDRGGRPEIE